MTTTLPVRTAEETSGGAVSRGLVDPRWSHRRDEALGIVSATVLLGAACGLLIGCLGWPGVVAAVGLYVAGLRWMWLCLGGASA